MEAELAMCLAGMMMMMMMMIYYHYQHSGILLRTSGIDAIDEWQPGRIMVGQRLWDLVRGGVGEAIHHRHEEMQDFQVARGGDGDWPVVSACVVRACEMKPERDPTSYCTCFNVPTS